MYSALILPKRPTTVLGCCLVLVGACSGPLVDVDDDGTSGTSADDTSTSNVTSNTAPMTTSPVTTGPNPTTSPTTSPATTSPATTSPATTMTTLPTAESGDVSVGSFSTGEPPGGCGDGQVGPGEQCDGDDLQGFDCDALGLGGGSLFCNQQFCTFDTSQCTPDLTDCGNGIKEDGESCDGDDVGGNACENLGLGAGELGCTDDCQFDISNCEGMSVCGDGIAQPGEFCDGNDLRGGSCADYGLGGPQLACNAACAFDFTACEGETGDCRNGVLDPGEQCDGNDTQGFDCASLGLGFGALGCDPVACVFDTFWCFGT